MIQRLKRNKAKDPGGWSHECVQTLWKTGQIREPFFQWILATASPQAAATNLDLVATSQVVMLNKPEGRALGQ